MSDPVFDPRYNNLVLGLTYRTAGGLPSSRAVTLRVVNGEGQVWLDPATTPTIGTITAGTLVIASESFPRYAPLTMTLSGADLGFTVRLGQLLNFALVDGRETLLRLHCSSLMTAAYAHHLKVAPVGGGLTLTRVNRGDADRTTTLNIEVLQGAIAGLPGKFRRELDGAVLDDRVLLQRDAGGVLKLRFHGARMEWLFEGGRMSALRVFDSQGALASLRLLNLSGAGVAVSAALMDTLS
jgi:hypothetical protein